MRGTISTLLFLCCMPLLTSCVSARDPGSAAAAPERTSDPAGNSWFRAGQDAVRATLAQPERTGRARNVILFIGDGMSLDTVVAARIFAGQQRGENGEENWLGFERLPHTALMKTYTTDLQVPDSAGTATAMLSGVKTQAGVLGVDERVKRGRCASLATASVPSFLERMEARGKATGIVSTARITHATPASSYAHVPSRGWESDANIPPAQRDCADIARQLVEFDIGDGIEVILGGGRSAFMPSTAPDPEYADETGARIDGRNLIDDWLRNSGPGAHYVWNSAQFDSLATRDTRRILGLFEPSHMQYEADRIGAANEPSLAAMTSRAIELLSRDADGYFLLVEGGRIDHAHHAGNAARALHDTLAFDAAIAAALQRVNLDDTLVIVTADHGHVMSFSGYPVRGNPILGKVVTGGLLAPKGKRPALDSDGLPYTTLSYANGPGHRKTGSASRPDLTNVDTEDLDYMQEATLPLSSETHSGADVIVYADGPQAHLFRGVQEQHYVFHVMQHAVGE